MYYLALFADDDGCCLVGSRMHFHQSRWLKGTRHRIENYSFSASIATGSSWVPLSLPGVIIIKKINALFPLTAESICLCVCVFKHILINHIHIACTPMTFKQILQSACLVLLRRGTKWTLKCKKWRKGFVVHVFSLDTISKTSNTRQEYCSSFVLSLSNARIIHQMSFTQSTHIWQLHKVQVTCV